MHACCICQTVPALHTAISHLFGIAAGKHIDIPVRARTAPGHTLHLALLSRHGAGLAVSVSSTGGASGSSSKAAAHVVTVVLPVHGIGEGELYQHSLPVAVGERYVVTVASTGREEVVVACRLMVTDEHGVGSVGVTPAHGAAPDVKVASAGAGTSASAAPPKPPSTT